MLTPLDIYLYKFVYTSASLVTLPAVLILFYFYKEQKRPLHFYAGLLALALFFVTIQMHISQETQMLRFENSLPFQYIEFGTLAVSNIFASISAPLFFYSFFEKRMKPFTRIIMGVFIGWSIYCQTFHIFFIRTYEFYMEVCEPLIYCSLLFTIIRGILFYLQEKDEDKKKTINVILILTAVFIPLLIIDSYLPYESRTSHFLLIHFQAVGPLFFSILSLFLIRLGLRHRESPGEIQRNDERFYADNKLTQREQDVVELIVRGFKTSEVADLLKITNKGVESHITRIYRKCQVSSRVELLSEIINHC